MAKLKTTKEERSALMAWLREISLEGCNDFVMRRALDDLDTLEAENAALRSGHDGTQKKEWGEHFREAVTALAAADTALGNITGWSGGGGNWSAQETHPRVQAALVLLRGKHGDDPRVDAFLAELSKVRT